MIDEDPLEFINEGVLPRGEPFVIHRVEVHGVRVGCERAGAVEDLNLIVAFALEPLGEVEWLDAAAAREHVRHSAVEAALDSVEKTQRGSPWVNVVRRESIACHARTIRSDVMMWWRIGV